MRTTLLVLFGLLTCGSLGSAGEIATGSMLGPRYDSDSFYVRQSPRSDWERTYDDRPYRKQARGKLMGVRVPQAIFDDEWLGEDAGFDPDANVDALIATLDYYKAHGVLALAVSLQGEDPGYENRSGEAVDGREKGALISAFAADGSLKPAWGERLERLLRAADKRGMFVSLTYFTRLQDEALDKPSAVVAAARNVTRWLVEKNLRNVIINVGDSWDVQDGRWDHGRFIPSNIANLVGAVREQFNGAAFSLPIGAAAGESLAYPQSLAQLCDVVLVHGDGLSGASQARGLAHMTDYGRPLWVVSDDDPAGGLKAAAARGAGWVYSPVELASRFPFAYQPDADFQKALDRIAELTLRKPPKIEGEEEPDR